MGFHQQLSEFADSLARVTVRMLGRVRGAARPLKGSIRTSAPARPRLTIVQFGDYREAFTRFRDGGAETYYAQRYTVDFVANLARDKRVECVHVITCLSDAPPVELAPRLWHGGVHLYAAGQPPATTRLLSTVADTQPSHVVVATPFVPLLRLGLERGYRLLPLFADSFRGGGVKQRARNAFLAYVLNDPRIQFVSNHSLAAALDLVRIGVDAKKVVPFDWPPLILPTAHSPKQAPDADKPFRLLYVGQLTEPKGVGDLIRAVAEFQGSERRVVLSLIGAGDEAALSALCGELRVDDRVSFLGKRSHAEVQAAMREHDAVVVPSRHSYPEGLPMTLYEALCSRTPLLASDHPMFALRIRDGFNALVFRAQSPGHLAERVRELMSNPRTYESLSRNSEAAAKNYLCPTKWDRLLTAWLTGDTASISPYNIAEMEQ